MYRKPQRKSIVKSVISIVQEGDGQLSNQGVCRVPALFLLPSKV
jgi:hypothetical protein